MNRVIDAVGRADVLSKAGAADPIPNRWILYNSSEPFPFICAEISIDKDTFEDADHIPFGWPELVSGLISVILCCPDGSYDRVTCRSQATQTAFGNAI